MAEDTGVGDTNEPQGGDDVNIDELLNENKSLKSKVNEFRNNNIKLSKQFDSVQEQLAELEQLKEQLAEKDREVMKAKGQTEEALQSQIEEMRRKFDEKESFFQQKLSEVETNAKTYEQRYKNLQMDQRASEFALKAGVQKGALPYVLNDIRDAFEMDEDGDLVPKEENRFNTDTGKEWTLETWLEKYRDEKTFLFEGSTGGGAAGGAKGGGVRKISSHDFRYKMANNPDLLKAVAEGKVIVED